MMSHPRAALAPRRARRAASCLVSLAAALALVACGTPGGAPDPSPSGSVASEASPGTVGTSGTSAGDATTGGTSAPTRKAVDQSTPEAAMTSWLHALVAGNGAAVCSLMAKDGKPINSIKGAAAACAKTITPMLESLKELGGMFDGLVITGATRTGTKATFEAATTQPELAAQVIREFRAERISGKWYVTQ